MKYSNLIFFLLFISTTAFSQGLPQLYTKHVRAGDSLYSAKDFKNSALQYSAGFKANNWKAISTDRYNAACSWALAGVPDSAFYQLNRIATRSNYNNYNHIINDSDLTSLHADKRWKPLLEKIKENKEKAEANLNKPLVAILDSVFITDQKDRQQIDGIAAKHGWDSKEMKDHWKKIAHQDSLNLIKVRAILDTHGWLGADVLGMQGSSTLFLVIQHSDLATQEKYLPMLREAVKNGKAYAANLAMLEDRVALRQGKRQIYGSQIGQDPQTKQYYISPLEDPDNVDKRRASVGLGPLAEYVSHWQITWDPAQYKKDLPALEAKTKGK